MCTPGSWRHHMANAEAGETQSSTGISMKEMTLKMSHESVFKLGTDHGPKLLWGRGAMVLCNRTICPSPQKGHYRVSKARESLSPSWKHVDDYQACQVFLHCRLLEYTSTIRLTSVLSPKILRVTAYPYLGHK